MMIINARQLLRTTQIGWNDDGWRTLAKDIHDKIVWESGIEINWSLMMVHNVTYFKYRWETYSDQFSFQV